MIFSSSPRLKSWVPFFVIAFSIWTQAQTKTNLDIFKTFVDLSVKEALTGIQDKANPIFVNLKFGSVYNILEDQVYKTIQDENRKITSTENNVGSLALSYTIESSTVKYGEVFRDGFLGEHLLSRELSLQGSYRILNKESLVKSFSYANTDTVMFDEIETLENPSYPFTHGKIPNEPFLSNLFEPLVAVTAAAVVITLFFTIRSK